MFKTILSFQITESNPELPQPQPMAVIEYDDPHLKARLRANLFGGYACNGNIHLTVQPVAHQFNQEWIPCDLDDTAFPINVDEMGDIVQVQP